MGQKGRSMCTETNAGGGSLSVNHTESIICSSDSGAPLFPEVSSSQKWFALRVKSNFERTTALHLRERGYQEFLPTYTIRSRWSDRLKTIEKPLFPGYVFCLFNPQARLPVLTTPGVLHVVGIGKEPIAIDSVEMEAVWVMQQS